MHNILDGVPGIFQKKVERLIEINEAYAIQYFDQLLFLEEYKEKHPTRVVVFKCSDGRMLFAHFTGTPLGYLHNFRNLGGQFNFGWKGLQGAFNYHVKEASNSNNGCLSIVTYHYSKGDVKRGCKANNFDKGVAIRGAERFVKQIRTAYKDIGYPANVYPVVVGVETDEDSLILHSENGDQEPVNLGDLNPIMSENELIQKIRVLFPGMSATMCVDFLPLIYNNIKHIAEVRKAKRPITELDHNEFVVGIGGSLSFDWFHIPNIAILVGQHNPNVERPIRSALEVIKPSAKKQGFILLAGASYGKHNPESFAFDEARYYSRLGQELVKQHHPELVEFMYPMRILLNTETQKFKVI
ncbi:MAG: hypothetical protein WCF93_04210 [Candidatus Moraniibacteriota bacterium]